jgi:hypothetical protein
MERAGPYGWREQDRTDGESRTVWMERAGPRRTGEWVWGKQKLLRSVGIMVWLWYMEHPVRVLGTNNRMCVCMYE